MRPTSDVEKFRLALCNCEYGYQPERREDATYYIADTGDIIAIIEHYEDGDVYIGLN